MSFNNYCDSPDPGGAQPPAAGVINTINKQQDVGVKKGATTQPCEPEEQMENGISRILYQTPKTDLSCPSKSFSEI